MENGWIDALTDIYLSDHSSIYPPVVIRTESQASQASQALLKEPTDLVHIYIDNSNVLIKGRYSVAEAEDTGAYSYSRGLQFYQLEIEYGQLLELVLRNRKIGGNPVIVGSRPPSNDSLWTKLRGQNFTVQVFNRNADNKEKKVDSTLLVAGMQTILTRNPGILVLIAGDGDYVPMVAVAKENGWRVETWFWNSGISGELLSISQFISLNDEHRYFTYAHGTEHIKKMHVLELTGEKTKNWDGLDALKISIPLKLFAWYYSEGDSYNLYFFKREELLKAKELIEKNHPDIGIWEKVTKRGSQEYY